MAEGCRLEQHRMPGKIMSSSQLKLDWNKAVMAGISGAILGGISGGLIGASLDGGRGALIGGLVGAAYMGFAEGVTDAARKPGDLKPLWHRLVGTTILGAALG